MTSELDFGDRELFEQLDGDEAAAAAQLHCGVEEAEELRERLRESEEAVRELRAENQELRRKLNILTRPSGITVEDSKLDGPLLQILFMNNTVSKQYHQETEEFVSSLVHRYEEQQRNEPEKTCFNVKPQPSSFVLDEDFKMTSANISKKIKDSFSVVGSVLYFTNFCLDKLGQPILNENPQLTDGWEIPKYQQVFTQILSLDGQEIQVKPKRPKPHCFNCGSEDHQMKDCPQPRNAARINEKRKEFLDACGEAGSQSFQQRYHVEEVEERFGRFKPGIISEELQDALGVTDKALPPFIYRMRQLGYPPGWLREAEMEQSGLTLYDGTASPDSKILEEEYHQQNQSVTYDTSKLINYPGFNMSIPNGVMDEWRMFGSVPLQPSQQKDIFAHYLSTYHSASPKSRHKRSSSHQRSHHSKKQKGNSAPPTDMEIDSDSEAPLRSQGCDGFQFQPPLPPGSPLNTVPSRDVPVPRILSSITDEDMLTLEELEEQQRQIWAALEQAESGNSDSDIPTGTPLTGNSVASSPSRTEPDGHPEEITNQPLSVLEPELSDSTEQIPTADMFGSRQTSASELIDLTEEEEPSHKDLEGQTESSSSALGGSRNFEEQQTHSAPSVDAQPPPQSSNPVPDMSKFAVGITPFEFDNMAESTGTYLRIRSVLKKSPRNQQKSKKASF